MEQKTEEQVILDIKKLQTFLLNFKPFVFKVLKYDSNMDYFLHSTFIDDVIKNINERKLQKPIKYDGKDISHFFTKKNEQQLNVIFDIKNLELRNQKIDDFCKNKPLIKRLKKHNIRITNVKFDLQVIGLRIFYINHLNSVIDN